MILNHFSEFPSHDPEIIVNGKYINFYEAENNYNITAMVNMSVIRVIASCYIVIQVSSVNLENRWKESEVTKTKLKKMSFLVWNT